MVHLVPRHSDFLQINRNFKFLLDIFLKKFWEGRTETVAIKGIFWHTSHYCIDTEHAKIRRGNST